MEEICKHKKDKMYTLTNITACRLFTPQCTLDTGRGAQVLEWSCWGPGSAWLDRRGPCRSPIFALLENGRPKFNQVK